MSKCFFKILNLRSTAVKMARELGEFIVLELPPFVQPLKDLVEYVSNLFSRVKSDFMDFYTVRMKRASFHYIKGRD